MLFDKCRSKPGTPEGDKTNGSCKRFPTNYILTLIGIFEKNVYSAPFRIPKSPFTPKNCDFIPLHNRVTNNVLFVIKNIFSPQKTWRNIYFYSILFLFSGLRHTSSHRSGSIWTFVLQKTGTCSDREVGVTERWGFMCTTTIRLMRFIKGRQIMLCLCDPFRWIRVFCTMCLWLIMR